jgi:hypothetical protein
VGPQRSAVEALADRGRKGTPEVADPPGAGWEPLDVDAAAVVGELVEEVVERRTRRQSHGGMLREGV